jgi:hypothetical protein
MKPYLGVVAAAAMVVVSIAATPVFAQPPRGIYWTGDICRSARAHAANRGTAIGAVTGGAVGAAVGGNATGAIVGAGAGALAGRAIGRSRVRCVDPPPRRSRRHNCQWVQDNFNGRWHTFEVCRGRDGAWRPSGR